MKKVCVILVVVFCFFLYNSNNMVLSSSPSKEQLPIFDGNIGTGSNLRCIHATSDTSIFTKSSTNVNFKSNKGTYRREIWGSNGKVVNIEVYYFEYAEDALKYPAISNPFFQFPGWEQSPSPAIGDKTCWCKGAFALLFIKGTTLVKITNMSKNLFDKDFMIRVAKRIYEMI